MEPSSQQPERFPERPAQPGIENPQPYRPEIAPSPERVDESREQATGAGKGDTPPPQVNPLPPPLPAFQPAAEPKQAAPTQDDTPLLAADDDLIEKEWVDKAKKIIAETKHDPYLQEREVSRLQATYLQKRYGKSIKSSGNE